MKKLSERINVLTESENKSFIHAVINAVTKGYSDNTVIEDILDLIRRKEVSKGVITVAPETLRTYGESFRNSLNFLADQIELLEIVDEPTITKRQLPENTENVIEEEMKKEEKTEKTSSINKFSSLLIDEDYDKKRYDIDKNALFGTIKLKFSQDLSCFKVDKKLKFSRNELDEVIGKVYNYLIAKHKIKSSLTPDIFKSKLKFTSIKNGEAEIDYLINEAF
jgi:hypothetical protein